MKRLLYTLIGLVACGVAYAQVTDTVTNSAGQLRNGINVQPQPPATSSPAAAHPTEIGRRPANNAMRVGPVIPPPTEPPNTNGIPPSPGSPAAGPVNQPNTAPTQPAVDPRLMPKP